MKKLALIHGTNHSPSVPEHDPGRPGGHFEIWQKQVFPECATVPFAWESGLLRLEDWLKAWFSLHFTPYGRAYRELAEAAAIRLSEMTTLNGQNAFAHSLGTKVVVDTLCLNPAMFDRVILCNGAVAIKDALHVIEKNPETTFLNIAVRGDRVLSGLGSWFHPELGRDAVIGNGIPVGDLPNNVHQVILDDPEHKAIFAAYGWDLRGDNPDSIGDHSYSFLWPGNWALMRLFLDTGGLPV